VLIVFGTAVVAFLVGLISYKLPALRTLGKTDDSITFREVVDDFKQDKKYLGTLTLLLKKFELDTFLYCYLASYLESFTLLE